MRILLAHPFGEHHKGDITVLDCTLMLLRKISNAEVSFRYKKPEQTIIKRFWLKFVDTLKADVVVFSTRDDLSLTYGFPSGILCSLLFAVALRKPFMLFAAQIGPFDESFKGKVASFFTRVFLNRASLITIRDQISRRQLNVMNVTKPPIYVTRDLGFLLKPLSPDEAKTLLSKQEILIDGEKIIGVNISASAYRYAFPEVSSLEKKYPMYVDLMSKLIDYMIEKWDVRVISVPHVFERGSDDRAIAVDVHEKVRNKDRFDLITGELGPEELKGIIALCDMFITTRYHPLIHSTSTCVPTIAIDYTSKMKDTMRELGCYKWYCHISNTDFEELSKKTDELWVVRQEVRETLKTRMETVLRLSAFNADLIEGFVTQNEL